MNKPMEFTVDQALTMTEKYGTYECRKFRERIFSSHENLTYELASRYVRVAEDIWLRINIYSIFISRRNTFLNLFYQRFLNMR